MSEPTRQPYQLPPLGPVAGIARSVGEPHDTYVERIKAAGWVVELFKGDAVRLVAVKGDRRIVVEKKSELGAWIELQHQIAPNGWPQG